MQYSQVIEKAEHLFKVNKEIKDFISFTDEDYDTTESSSDRFMEIRVIYERN